MSNPLSPAELAAAYHGAVARAVARLADPDLPWHEAIGVAADLRALIPPAPSTEGLLALLRRFERVCEPADYQAWKTAARRVLAGEAWPLPAVPSD